MTKRTLLAAILAGIGMFIWTSLAHTVLPLGEAGVREIPNEAAVLTAMRGAMGEAHGLYLYPGFGLAPDATKEQKSAAQQAYGQKLASNPWGVVVYNPAGTPPSMPVLLATEFIVEMILALVAVWLLTQTRLQSIGGRMGFFAMVGILGSVWTNASYWNWYGFPTSYTLAYAFTQFAGYLVAGLIATAILRNRALSSAAASA